MLNTLFVKLKDPPICVQVPGLPENVVPVYPTTNNMTVLLPNDEKYLIARTQVEVLVNFAMTDFLPKVKLVLRMFRILTILDLTSRITLPCLEVLPSDCHG